jgi:hypothetical protein
MQNQGLAPISALIGEGWDADDLRTGWVSPTTRVDLASVNGHFEQWRTQPATSTAGVFYNTDVLGAANVFTGSVNYSMGCHGGLNVPDEISAPNGPGPHDTWNPDYPQVFGSQAAVWVANTGYGYGMDDAIAGSEQVYYDFQKMLGSQDEIAAGEALRRAKWQMVKQLGPGGLGVYEEKSLIEVAFYGLPMYKVGLPTPGGLLRPSATSSQVAVEYLGDQVRLTLSPPLQSTGSGTYYSLDGETQAAAGRPLQPRTGVTVSAPLGQVVHGIVVLTATFTTATGFDPVIYRPVTDTALAEPGFSYPGWYMAKFWSLNTMEGEDTLGEEPRLVVVAGQYQSATEVTGTERIFRSLTFKVYTSDSADASAPAINEVNASGIGGRFAVEADVSDSGTGVQTVWVTYEDTPGHWASARLSRQLVTGLWTGTVTSSLAQFDYFVQAVDWAGNTSMSSNKSLYFPAAPIQVYLPLTLRNTVR